MIKTILFDFDGVICESSQMKTDAFEHVFERYPRQLEAITAYHKSHEGISRDIKLKFICEQMLSLDYTAELREALLNKFALFIDEKSQTLPLVKGVEQFILHNKHLYKYFIVSGARNSEIVSYLKKNNLLSFFCEIHDGDRAKPDIIRDIMHRYGYHPPELIFIGDAVTDLNASEELNLPGFIARVYNEDTPLSACRYVINDFTQIDEVLEKICLSCCQGF